MSERQQLSKYFSRHEVECHGFGCCGHSFPVVPELLKALDAFRDKVGEPVDLNCAFRCLKHNMDPGINSDDSSQHPRGYAADIRRLPTFSIDSMSAVAASIPAFANGGIGLYSWGIHVDVRDSPARWDKR